MSARLSSYYATCEDCKKPGRFLVKMTTGRFVTYCEEHWEAGRGQYTLFGGTVPATWAAVMSGDKWETIAQAAADDHDST